MTDLNRLPNLLLPGAPKSGTSSLAWYLTQHPDVCPGDRKEINYFLPLSYGRPARGSLEDYAAHFNDCGGQAYRLDASAGYFHGGRDVVATIQQTLPHARVVIILRNPVDRLFSSYRSKRDRAKIDARMSFRAFFETSREVHADSRDGEQRQSQFMSVGVGVYVETTRHWLDFFGDAVNVVFFEHLAADPERLVTDLCRALDLEVGPVRGLDYAVRNVTVTPRSRAISAVARGVNLRADRRLRRHPRAKQFMRAAYATVNGRRRRETLTAEDRALVAEYYEPANRDLRRLLAERGLDNFPDWLSEST